MTDQLQSQARQPDALRRDPVAGRTALITGGGHGLGRAIAAELLANGADVIIVGRDAARLEETARELASPGRRATTAVCDVTDPAAVDDLRAESAGLDVSILVNNAGIPGPVKPLIEIEPAEWDEVFDVNVRGTYLVCRAFLPAMIERGRGDVINLASVTGKRPLARRTPYAASKSAVIALTTTLAAEVGPLGITVNTLSPGPVNGPRMERNFRLEAERTQSTYDEAVEAFVGRSALGRLVDEEEVGLAVVAMLRMPGLHAADIDLSAGMVGR